MVKMPPSETQIAFDIVSKLNELSAALTTHNANSAIQYQLNPFPSQNYWRGNNPVILLAGDSTNLTKYLASRRTERVLLYKTMAVITLTTICNLISRLITLSKPSP